MNKLKRYEEQRQGFNNTLRKFKLTEEQIFIQDLKQLEKSLQTINELINNDIERIEEIQGIILLERKKIILSRIQEQSSHEKIDNLQKLIDQVIDEEVKKKLRKELTALEAESAEYKKEMHEISAREAEAKLKIEQEQQRLDGLERKSKIWLSFLQRESAASLIGAVVLLLLTLSLIFGKESQILSNGFLVILGYFFGQSSTRTHQDNSKYGSPQSNTFLNNQ